VSTKSKFLKTIVKGGIAETSRKLKAGAMKRDELVDVEKELRDAKATIGSNPQVSALGITDDDLRNVIRQVASAHKLSVTLADGTVIEPSDKMSFIDRATSAVLSRVTPSPKGALYTSVKAALKMQAQNDVKKGTITLPVDVEGYATRIQSNTKRIPGLGLKYDDYKQAIREICEELDLEMKK